MWLPKQSKTASHQAGFTLIELLVTSALALIIIGGALFSYSNYQATQSQVAVGKQVISVLTTARNRSTAGDKPTAGCNTLEGYRVRAVANTGNYFLSVRCSGGVELESEQFTLADNYLFLSSGFDITFPYKPANVTASSITVNIGKTLPAGGKVFRFSILPSGAVEESGLVQP